MEKNIAIYQDQRIAEEFCNFKCEYCEGFYPTDYSLLKDKEGNLHVAEEWYKMIEKYPKCVQDNFGRGRSFDDFYNMASKIIEKSKEKIDTDILKISGGEVTIYKGLCDFVENLHQNYKMVQILSNGSNITDEDIKRYKKMGNITFQISLDGVTKEGNYGKSHSNVLTKRVVRNVEKLLENGLGVEINCVLTNHNTDKLDEILEYFNGYKGLMIVPRPVRGEPRNTLGPTKEQVDKLENFIKNNYDKYKTIIPPYSYFENLIDIMKTNNKKNNCYIPYFVQSVDGYGNYEMCPIGIFYDSNANIFSEEFNNNKYLIDSIYDIRQNREKCKDCINQYEMFNLYVDDIIKEEELRRMPSLDNDDIIKHIKEIKRKIKKRYDINGRVN